MHSRFGQITSKIQPVRAATDAERASVSTQTLQTSLLNLPNSSTSSKSSDASLSTVMNSVGSILGSLGQAVAVGYAAKMQRDTLKSQLKYSQMAPVAQQPVIIQQSGSNTGLWITLGVLGFISIGGLIYILVKK